MDRETWLATVHRIAKLNIAEQVLTHTTHGDQGQDPAAARLQDTGMDILQQCLNALL